SRGPLTDGELLARSAGDGEVFTAFYRRYEPYVLAFFGRRVGDAQLSADLCAETFAAALAAAGRYRTEHESAAPWLFGMARNVLGSSLRAGRVEAGARRRLGMLEPLVLSDVELER